MIALKSARQRALTLSSLVLHREHCRVRVLTQNTRGAPNRPTRMNARRPHFLIVSALPGSRVAIDVHPRERGLQDSEAPRFTTGTV